MTKYWLVKRFDPWDVDHEDICLLEQKPNSVQLALMGNKRFTRVEAVEIEVRRPPND